MADENALVITPETSVGERVRLARIAAGLTREQMARAIGVPLRTYDRIEAGSRELRLSELNALVAVTRQTLAFFGASFDEESGVLPAPLPELKAGEA